LITKYPPKASTFQAIQDGGAYMQEMVAPVGIEPIADGFWLRDAGLHDDAWMKELIGLAEDESETWNFLKQEDGVQIYQGGTDRRLLVRGRCIVKAHPGQVWAYLTRVEETLANIDEMIVPQTCRGLPPLSDINPLYHP